MKTFFTKIFLLTCLLVLVLIALAVAGNQWLGCFHQVVSVLDDNLSSLLSSSLSPPLSHQLHMFNMIPCPTHSPVPYATRPGVSSSDTSAVLLIVSPKAVSYPSQFPQPSGSSSFSPLTFVIHSLCATDFKCLPLSLPSRQVWDSN